MDDDDRDKALRASLVAWLRWHAPSKAERRCVPDACRPLLDTMARASGTQAVARLATEIQNAERDLTALRAQRDEARELVRRYWKSMHPHPVEHPTMFATQEVGKSAIERWDEEAKR